MVESMCPTPRCPAPVHATKGPAPTSSRWTVPALVDTRLGCLGLKEFRHGFDTTALHG